MSVIAQPVSVQPRLHDTRQKAPPLPLPLQLGANTPDPLVPPPPHPETQSSKTHTSGTISEPRIMGPFGDNGEETESGRAAERSKTCLRNHTRNRQLRRQADRRAVRIRGHADHTKIRADPDSPMGPKRAPRARLRGRPNSMGCRDLNHGPDRPWGPPRRDGGRNDQGCAKPPTGCSTTNGGSR